MESKTLLIVLVAVLLSVELPSVKGTESWYQGCMETGSQSNNDHWSVPVVLEVNQSRAVAQCSRFCLKQRMSYAAVQRTTNIRCMCSNFSTAAATTLATTISATTTTETTTPEATAKTVEVKEGLLCCSISHNGLLPIATTDQCWAIYTSEGPYLTAVTIETDHGVAIVNQSTVLEIFIAREAALNITKDDKTTGHAVMVIGKINSSDATFQDGLDLHEYTEIYHRPRHTFTDIGTHTVDVTIDNNISSLSTTFTVRVIYPEPVDLEVRLTTSDLAPNDTPSCIPPEVMVTRSTNQEVAVFVNTTTIVETSVSMGTNVTFTFKFEDTGESLTLKQQGENNEVTLEHVFAQTGNFLVHVTATNQYGSINKVVNVLVVQRQLSDLWIGVNPSSSPIATPGHPVSYKVSMVTTSRSNIYLQVWYGDGLSNIVPIEDTNTSALVLKGEGKYMDIVASYGDGCTLMVEFDHKYAKEGTYKAKAALYGGLTDADIKAKSEDGVTRIPEEKVGQKEQRLENFEYMDMPMDYLEDSYGDNDVEAISQYHGTDDNALLESDSAMDVLVVSVLSGLRIQSKTFGTCEYSVEFDLQNASPFNLTVHWLIYRLTNTELHDDLLELDADDLQGDTGSELTADADDNFELMVNVTVQEAKLYHSFPLTGFYKVKALAVNALSKAEAVTTIMIQCPVEGLHAFCSSRYVKTGAEVKCEAFVESGSNVVFTWLIQEDSMSMVDVRYVRYSNFSSVINHRFDTAGVYSVSVQAMNNISVQYMAVEPLIEVIDPIEKITVLRMTHTLLGNDTEFIALHYLKRGDEFCEFKFDFGEGPVGEELRSQYKEDMRYVRTQHRFPAAGEYTVTVYGYNEVSQTKEIFQVWVHSRLDKVKVEMVNQALVGIPARFKVIENGEIMSTENVYFEWKFRSDAEIYRTNSPLAQTLFKQPGSFIVQLRIINPVEERWLDIPVTVIERSKVNLLLLHELYVAPGDDVTFEVTGSPIGWTGVHVTYSEGVAMEYEGPITSWEHVFDMPGPQLVTVNLVNQRGARIAELSTYVMVERPIRGLEITGPEAVAYDRYGYYEWAADVFSGTSILYKWTLHEPIFMTMPQYQTNKLEAGMYDMTLEAYNDLSPHPVSAVKSFIIEYPVRLAHIKIFGNYVGQETVIQVNIWAFHEFYTNICFGDGHNVTMFSLDDEDKVVSSSEDEHSVVFKHIYEGVGEYQIIVNVSNSISHIVAMETFVPIVNVTLTSRTQWLIPSHVPAIVMATVIGGIDLEYIWDFGDNFGQTTTESYGNQTQVAEHLYQLYGEYQVTFTVTGPHYPHPGVKVTLPSNITVLWPIDEVDLITEKYAAALNGNSTQPQVFQAMSSGSHVMFVFDYGDGTKAQCAGNQLPMQHVVFTMTCEGRHVYTEEGEYRVSVTAHNALGNLTQQLSQTFYVQKPPHDLHFCGDVKGNPGNSYYATSVGATLTLCAQVTMGTNVTFDWKLGDQTDVVKAGSIVTHQYNRPATNTVYVTARNRVKDLVRATKVYVNYKIQGVQMIPETTVVASGQVIRYTAVVLPNHTDLVNYYTWTFKTPSKVISRLSKGPTFLRSKLPYVSFIFKESGWCSVRVRASNYISSYTSDSVDIHVQERIKELQIVIKNKTDILVNRPISFSYFMYEGSDIRLNWNFGDGSFIYNASSQKEVVHIYNRSAVYNVTLTAENQVSRQTVSMLLFILERPYCHEPKVNILNKHGSKFLFSRGLTLEADIQTDCNLTSVIKFDWSVDGHVTKEMMDKRVLVLPPRSLSIGQHVIQLKVLMWETIVFSIDSTMVEIVPSNLSCQIHGGMFQRVSADQTIVVDASGSFDPDHPTQRNFSFSWTCHFAKGNYYGKQCFLDPLPSNVSCDLALNTSILQLDPRCLVRADNFTFELTLYLEGRSNVSAVHVVEVVREKTDILSLKIVRPFSVQDPVNPDRKLSFFVDCMNCPREGVTYQWSLKHLADHSIYSLSRAHDRPCVEPNGASYFSIILKERENKEAEARLLPSTVAPSLPQTANQAPEVNSGSEVNQDIEVIEDTKVKVKLGSKLTDLSEIEVIEGNINTDFVDVSYDDIRTDYGMSTLPPMYQLVEGDVGYNRRRRSPPQEFDTTTEATTLIGISVIEENQGTSSRIRTRYDIDTLPFVESMKEGSPGESGSSGGRGLYSDVVEAVSTGREETSQVKQESDVGSGGKLSENVDAVERDRTDQDRKFTILDHAMIPVHLREEQTRTGLNTSSLVIKPRVLQQGLTYVIQVKAIYQGHASQMEGYTMSTFRVNESPNSGDCTVTPHSGVALETEFTFFCKAWKDEHVPLMYEVGYNFDQSSERKLIYRGVNRRYAFRLPAGLKHADHHVYLYIDILDALLAKTSVCSIKIKVLPKNHNIINNSSTSSDSSTNNHSKNKDSNKKSDYSSNENNSSSNSSSNSNSTYATTVTESSPAPKLGPSEAQLIHDEISGLDSYFQLARDRGQDAVTKVYISYLATWLNQLQDTTHWQTKNQTNHSVAYSVDNIPNGEEAASDIDKFNNQSRKVTGYTTSEDWTGQAGGPVYNDIDHSNRGEDRVLRIKARKELLKYLDGLPVRDEAELLQSAEALAVTTKVPEELSVTAIDASLKILKGTVLAAKQIYSDGVTPTGSLVPLVVQSASSIIKATTDLASEEEDTTLMSTFKQIVEQSVAAVESVILMELQYHMIAESPIYSSTDFFSVLAQRQASDGSHSLQIGNARFNFTPSFNANLTNEKLSDHLTRHLTPTLLSWRPDCLQSHMTMFQQNPFSFGSSSQVESLVTGLNLYNCQGDPIHVDNLPADQRIQVQLPNIHPQNSGDNFLTLKKWSMNVHQFNVSGTNFQQALHIVVELDPVNQGRLFPITVLISHRRIPSPTTYLFKYDFTVEQNDLDIFLPPGSFNDTGTFYIGIVDTKYNAGRHRPGEITERHYRLKLWWGECLFWHNSKEAWLPDGCTISQDSSFQVTKCECNHLTAFGGRFELIPNNLQFVDVEGFFYPERNPVSLSLICVLLIIYLLLFIWSHLADRHDNRKGGIVYLLDNGPMDQQKYEITLVTGFRKEAGTTAKISLILHGEEGMSETRELISDDDRPLFERNSRDKFILSLPDSIGRVWKVQLWHNNQGPSPSWFLSRVHVRDLNTGCQYFFLCEKWLAVEEQDGKVEREFMALDGPLEFSKAFVSRSLEYLSDFHLWISLITCPPYSGFMRTERLTVCLTTLLMYMCLNAVWYNITTTEYRGEFGLLDLSWRNLTVGAICCGVVMPISLFLEFLFRRSKPKNASSCHTKDEVADWDHEYVSGKPNEQDSEDTSEHVPPVMTYSLLDQSFLNWPNIQTWAQKQWLKRQQSVRSNPDSNSGTSVQSAHSATTALTGQPSTNMAEVTLGRLAFSEMDQASSGFEDCNSLIRPKASVDSMHTTAAPSVSESMHVHKPQSLPDSLRVSKPASNLSSTANASNSPSISSSGSNFHKSSVMMEKRDPHQWHLYLPWWCRYISWSLCALLCIGSATVTIMYGYRFGITKSTMWLQSLYFSAMICIFIANPFLILIAVVYNAIKYKNDPSSFESYSYDLFNREKAKDDLRRWKKQMESWDEGGALERGVAARQRSRYLRFARPPQEKQLIEARKRVMKEKKALSIFRESVAFVLSLTLLLIMAYGKDTQPGYRLNLALRNQFTKSGTLLGFSNIRYQQDWYNWAQSDLLDALGNIRKLDEHGKQVPSSRSDTYIIGQPQLRLQRISMETCHTHLPKLLPSCLGSSHSQEMGLLGYIPGLRYTNGNHGNFVLGRYGIYDGSGIVLYLNLTRSEAVSQLLELQQHEFLDRQMHAVFVEFTLYNAPTNLFTAVQLLMEASPTGGVATVTKVISTQLFRYVTGWDNVVLACELLFFVLMMLALKSQLVRIVKMKTRYFTFPWNVLNFIICVLSMGFCVCYVYRFVIVSSTVESLRSTYYEKYVDLTFITFWDELMQCEMAILLFLSTVKCLRLLRYNKQFTIFGDVYRKARREIIIFFAMFMIILAAYTSLGHALFGSMLAIFRDLWTSLLGVTILLTGSHKHPEFYSPRSKMAANIFMFSFVVFSTGFLTAYMVAVLTHYFRVRKKRRLLAMGGWEAILFYWDQFQLWTGIKRVEPEEEPVIILPSEFTLAEIEYQVDELLFRMNALTGSHGLPEKPPCYLTDSDCTYGGGDDGISSGGSEPGVPGLGIEDRLEQRVQKIEDNLYSQEPFLAQLLKLDSVGTDDFSQEKEKQLRSHLELEIFLQLQIQRQDLKVPAGVEGENNKGDNSNGTSNPEYQKQLEQKLLAPKSPGNDSTSSDEMTNKQTKPGTTKPTLSKPKRTKANLTVQTIQDVLGKVPHELNYHNHDNTNNSSPDSPKDKQIPNRAAKHIENTLKKFNKPNTSSTSSSEKIGYDSPGGYLLSDTDNIRKPTKPTFLHSRESSLSDGTRGSPALKLRTNLPDKGSRSESVGGERLFESSSGSEQDGIPLCRKLLGKRSLRKTKSRGKGKCSDSLEAALVLDEIEWEEGNCFGNDVIVESVQGETIAENFHNEVMAEIQQREITSNLFTNKDKGDKNEQIVQADVHHV